MTRAVVILGAGASADFGVPTLQNMFKDPRAVSYLKGNAALTQMLNRLFWEPRGHTLASSEKSLSIEQMLTILKDWEKTEGVREESRPQNVSEFRRGLYVLIQKAVFEGKSSRGGHLNPLISVCRRAFEHTTWASFNWDCIFESSFWYSQPYYGAGSRANPTLSIDIENWYNGTSKHTYLKLHGGINWWLINDKVTYLAWTGRGELQQKWADYDRSPNSQDRPVILEPSFYKYEDSLYKQLAPQWTRFFDDLIQADVILVIGYSLPEMDINARSRILTAFQVNQNARWLVIDPSEQVCDLYRKLLGTARVDILQMTLAAFNNDLETHLHNAFPDIELSPDSGV